MEARGSLRTTLVTAGTFTSVPSAFPSASEGVRNAVKLDIHPFLAEDSEEDQPQLALFPDRVLIDLGAVDASQLDQKALVTDCEILLEAARRYPEGFRAIIEGLQAGTLEGIRDADEMIREMGLSEDAVAKSGGGLFFLVIIAVAVVAGAGCVKRGTQTKVGNEATTPGHGTGTVPGGGGSDGGTPDGGEAPPPP